MKNSRTQTQQYRSTLCANRARSREAETQTTAEFRKPIPVHFVPAPSGVDGVTQILTGDLFDFNTEVEPLLEILISRTLDAARREVIEYSELHKLRDHQERFERVRQAEIIEIQRLEAASHRREQEKIRRINQEKANKELQRIALSKAMATRCAKDTLGRVHVDALKYMQRSGIFKDPILVEFEQRVAPGYFKAGIDAFKRMHHLNVLFASGLFAKPPKGKDISTKISDVLKRVRENATSYNAALKEKEQIRAIEKELYNVVVTIFATDAMIESENAQPALSH